MKETNPKLIEKTRRFRSPLEASNLPWQILPTSCLLESNFQCKEEFLAISQIISESVGMPTAVCVLAGNIVGAWSWEKINLATQQLAITESSGVFEASAMTYFHVKGEDAASLLDRLTPRDIHRLKPGYAMFVLFTTPLGTVDDEALVLRLSKDEFLLSCGGCKTFSKPLTFLEELIDQYPKVTIGLSNLVSFNLKGPKRISAMLNLLKPDEKNKVEALADFQFCNAHLFNGDSVLIVKSKIGIEMWGAQQTICLAWSAMLEQPTIYTPCGWKTLHRFRMDCNEILFSLYPLDIHCGTSLWEIGCGWMTKEKNRTYIGKEALLNGKNRKILQLKKIYATSLLTNTPEIGTVLNTEEGDFAGYITSSAFSLRTDRAVAFAHLSPTLCDHQKLYLEGRTESWLVSSTQNDW